MANDEDKKKAYEEAKRIRHEAQVSNFHIMYGSSQNENPSLTDDDKEYLRARQVEKCALFAKRYGTSGAKIEDLGSIGDWKPNLLKAYPALNDLCAREGVQIRPESEPVSVDVVRSELFAPPQNLPVELEDGRIVVYEDVQFVSWDASYRDSDGVEIAVTSVKPIKLEIHDEDEG